MAPSVPHVLVDTSTVPSAWNTLTKELACTAARAREYLTGMMAMPRLRHRLEALKASTAALALS
jgi:hypothetical protein